MQRCHPQTPPFVSPPPNSKAPLQESGAAHFGKYYSSRKAWSIQNNFLVGHDTLFVTVPFLLMPMNLR